MEPDHPDSAVGHAWMRLQMDAREGEDRSEDETNKQTPVTPSPAPGLRGIDRFSFAFFSPLFLSRLHLSVRHSVLFLLAASRTGD